MHVEIYTDGAAQGNPGPGGYGVILKYGDKVKKLAKGFRLTTNNRMELMAVIAGLEALKKNGLDVEVISDSRYVVDAVERGWLSDWVKKNFKNKKNRDLWERFLQASSKHRVKFKWIKGHNDHPYNEMCDRMAVEAASSPPLAVDTGYESGLYN
ncbi:MAG: ribonuclease H [Chitinophagales bacterium]|nr:MAG: ribonuclease H [Chitinophagales bacterium]